MFFGNLTIAINGFSMFFLFFYHRFQWFSMVPDHWSNDAMVSMDRCGLHGGVPNLPDMTTAITIRVNFFASKAMIFQDTAL